MSTSIPRFMVAAPSSGSGKTVVTCALLRALARRGLACAAFKCGPDYIDPLFHRRVVGARSGNLDGFFTDAPTLRALLARGAAGADVAVLEGVMGFYDGMAPGVADASSYQVARDTETPVVLVVNGRGASLSLAAVIRGIAEFLPCANVRGVVLNKTSAAACAYAAPAIEKHTGVAVLGNIPADEAFSLESRHLGLVTADEVEQLSARIDKMAELLEKSVDVDRLLEIAATAPDIREEPYRLEPIAGARPIVAVARDEAFSFYYEENLRALEDLGCELAFFSPLCDSELPRGTSALYLGGGYPELHARQLSENAPMREAVRRAVESGMPTVAECGGFLYLQREIADSEGRRWPVAGALEGASENGGRLSHFGYVELTSQRDGLYGPRGTRIRAHEFHYWQSTCPGGDFWAQKPRRDKGWPCMTTAPSLVAGFPHVYYPANPDVARAVLEAALSRIAPADECARAAAYAAWDSIAHPLGGLGDFEDAVACIAAAQGSAEVAEFPRALAVFFSDNGVVAEGVSQSGQDVTRAVARNMCEGAASACRMAAFAGAEVVPVDVGMARGIEDARMVRANVRRGSGNIALGSAMSRDGAVRAIEVGIAVACGLARAGVRLLAAGEMGIGNTTTSAAVAAVLIRADARSLVGRGAGLSDASLARKRDVVERAIDANSPDPADPIDVLSKVGGFDIAAMCGFYLGAAVSKAPALLDGVISCTAALCAARLCPNALGYLVGTHASSEPASRELLRELGIKAPLDAGMHLGEGAGAMAYLPLLDSALRVYRDGKTFTATGMAAYEHFEAGK